ncbi:hypothetical protein VC74_gp82 [Mycobacterium phage Sparky]|uniref:Uncharacterized protein n=1 Tax=Mycobacterium phage Sparky TaxID=1527493 RepID=A0A076G990_9CAUD|nr:hypothetical protein VC74_gp82 [Mycobacterium phage Sparky]AII28188.1 hypothetical protein PBI_SPARKY_44 [Mycobacterium phage Sparky]
MARLIPEVDTVESLIRKAKADMAKMNAQLARAEVWSEIEPAAPSESASPAPSPGEIVGERP